MCTATMVVEKENVYALGIVYGVELLLCPTQSVVDING